MAGLTTAAIVAGVFVLVVYFVGIYNDLVHVRNNVDKAWNNIDVILQQRNDELVKLIDTCRGYMQHESGLLERITEMRTRYAHEKELTAKADAENQLQLGLSQLRHVWEAYPELRATENFQQVQNRVSAIESTISDRREQFNDSVNIYNIRTESFPDMLVAGVLSYERKPFLVVPEEKKQDVKMDFGQNATRESTAAG